MIRNPIDAAVYVSPEFSAFVERRVNDPDVEQPITLAQLRNYLADMLSDSFKEAESVHHFDVSDSVLDELDELIEEFGPSALAVEFLQAKASEPLSRVIEAVVNDENRENPPTLEEVQEAMASGLVTSLVGDGVIEEDEDDTLGAEIEALIGRFGPDALAEEFLRYE
jgi:hypothetical protein